MKRIAIIGGGFTGLVAARQLAISGYQVDIYEAGPEPGGLAACFQIGGTSIEKAYHHLFRTDVDIIKLIDDLGLTDRLEWRPSSVAMFRNNRLWPFMSPLDLIRFGACSWMGKIRTGIVALYLKHNRSWRELAGFSALDWMRKTCGASATSAIWEPLLTGKFSRYASEVSMAWLWARLHIRANSREIGEGEKLGYIRGGFIQVISALVEDLKQRGATIHTNRPIQGIRSNDTGATILVDHDELSYESVLFTGSSQAFARLTADQPRLDAYRSKLDAIGYLGAICHVFTSEQDLGKFYWINICDTEAPFLVFIQHTNLVPTSEYDGKHVYYIGAYLEQDHGMFTETDEFILSTWHSYLKSVFPHFDPLLIQDSHLFRFKDAQHIVDCDYEAKIPSMATPLPNVYLANFSQIYPEDRGTNFAVREGYKVASLINDKK